MQNTGDTAEVSQRRLGRNLQYQTVPHGQTLATWDFKGTFATASTAANLYFPGLQGITKHFWFSGTFKGSFPYLSLMDQNSKRRTLADACGRKTSCSRKKDVWWSTGGPTVHTTPMWNFSCPFSEEQLLHWKLAQFSRSPCFPLGIMEQTIGIEQGDFLSQTEQKQTLVLTPSNHLELL